MLKEKKSISLELKALYSNISNQFIIDSFNGKVKNITLSNSKNRHFIIQGEKRNVSFYVTTGTVNAAPENGFKSTTIRGMKPERAIKRIISLANFGY